MSAKNDITGDSIKTKIGDQNKYTEGWERIFGDKKQKTDNEKSKSVDDGKQSKNTT